MPADWISFISNVSQKFESQSLKSSDDLADYLAKQYTAAIVGKAQSPYGNTHKKGKEEIIKDAFAKGFKMLENERSPTFAEKEENPLYEDLNEPLPETDATDAADQVELDFRDWTAENKDSIPDFIYSQFFSQFPNYPQDRKQAAIEIARKILYQFDGTSSYLQWMFSLRTGSYSDWGNLIMDEVVNIINFENKRPIQTGDLVRGFAKYKVVKEIWNTTGINGVSTYSTTPVQYYGYNNGYNQQSITGSNQIFNALPGDTNVDNISDLSTSSVNLANKRDLNRADLIEGKVISSNYINGVGNIKISIYNKSSGKYFIREIIPSTVTRKFKLSDITNKLPSINITRELFQDQHLSNPNKIPAYLTSAFIRNFTYSKRYDGGFLRKWLENYSSIGSSAIDNLIDKFDNSFDYADDIVNILSKNGFSKTSFFYNNSSSLTGLVLGGFNLTVSGRILAANKSAEYNSEEIRFRDLKIRWINEIADAAKKNVDPDRPSDPYDVMAKGILDYWKSTGVQPLTSTPPVIPAIIVPPQGGVYTPIYYGSQARLGNYLKRAFNSGKSYRGPGQKLIASKLVATALAFSFSMHLLELKFIYRGGIPTTNGPSPMIGFIPLVF